MFACSQFEAVLVFNILSLSVGRSVGWSIGVRDGTAMDDAPLFFLSPFFHFPIFPPLNLRSLAPAVVINASVTNDLVFSAQNIHCLLLVFFFHSIFYYDAFMSFARNRRTKPN